jgi:hypothetical protein
METAKDLLEPRAQSKLIQRIDLFEFAPLVARQTDLFASLEIVKLRSEPDGHIFEHGGDIDNCLTTLMDALKDIHPEKGIEVHGTRPSR